MKTRRSRFVPFCALAILHTQIAFCMLVSLTAQAAVQLNPLFTDHMVLQRNQPVPVYGTASPGEKVTVEFAGQKKEVVVSASGEWQVKLDPMSASAEPQTLTVRSPLDTRHLTLADVLVGDVWLCAGQSNMASEMKNYPTLRGEKADGMNNPLVRLFKFKREGIGSIEPSKTVVIDPPFQNSWQLLTPAFAREFSATGAFFGNALQPQAGVPVGLLYANRGGTAVNQWLPMDFMQSKADLYARYLGPENKWWTESESNPGLIRAPSRLFNGTIHPLLPFAIRGAIWYQGESDDRDADIYAEIFADLIKVWRGLWGYDFPFLFVQLAPYGSANWDLRGESWAFLREAQDRALALPNTGRAVIIDAGEQLDIHPQNKQPVGERLALLATRLDNPAVVADSPEFDSSETVGNKIRITFKHAGSGLTTKRVAMNKNKRMEPGMDPEAFVVEADSLAGFTICGADKKFRTAQAQIVSSNTVEVWADSVAEPLAVRYGWANFPLCNLYNQVGLPASPFRTDSFALPDFLTAEPIDADFTIQDVRFSVQDDFNRSNGSDIGEQWVRSGDALQWRISNSVLIAGQSTASQQVLYHNQVASNPGETIDLRVSVYSPTANLWGGLAFNYQDADNFYIVRIKFGTNALQILCHQNGAIRVVSSVTASQPFLVNRPYVLRLQAKSGQGVYRATVYDADSGSVLFEHTAKEAAAAFTGGHAGLYSGSIYASDVLFGFDNFGFAAGE